MSKIIESIGGTVETNPDGTGRVTIPKNRYYDSSPDETSQILLELEELVGKEKPMLFLQEEDFAQNNVIFVWKPIDV